MLGRRDFLLACGALLLNRPLWAATAARDRLGWQGFLDGMRALAQSRLAPSQAGQQGMALLDRLDPADPTFLKAIEASWESGNDYWLWQRLTKEAGLNGGILNIERGRDVPLHDHPGATGMLRILSGEVEVWQFDRMAGEGDRAELTLHSRRVLRPGDTAMLTPSQGNIHGLRAVSGTCRMLDYFIPPYRRADRAWYQPLAAGWEGRDTLHCRVVPERMRGVS